MSAPNPLPDDAFIVDDNGIPVGHINVAQLHNDAIRFMYAMAETAGDDDATTAVAIDWAGRHAPDYYGYLCGAALTLMTKNILAPTLECCDEVGIDLRGGLKRAAAQAHNTPGGHR